MSGYQDQIETAVAQIRALGAEGPPEAGPVEGVSANGAARLTVDSEGSVSVELASGGRESLEKAVAEALADLLTHFERSEVLPGVELPDFQGELSRLTGEMSSRLAQMQADMEERRRRMRS